MLTGKINLYLHTYTMDLKQIIGQLFVVGFTGVSVSKTGPLRDDLYHGNLGGVILFDRHLATNSDTNNISSASQVRRLCTDLQELAHTPLFISVDQEGGKVARLKSKYGFAQSPSAEEIGKTNSLHLSRQFAEQTATMLADVGINLNFAPVADVNCNPENPVIGKLERSFSSDPVTTTHHCKIWVEEFHKKKVYACLKHFPGHGSSTHDSHLDIVDISHTWREKELIPYQQLVQDGTIHCIMLGHLFHKKFDRQLPASLSRNVIAGILRGKLNFSGLVITDDMQMHAITNYYGFHESLLLAFTAGVDMVVIGNTIDYDPLLFQKAVSFLEQCVTENRLPLRRIMQAYQRVQDTKKLLL